MKQTALSCFPPQKRVLAD